MWLIDGGYPVTVSEGGYEFSFTTSLGLQYNVYFLPAKEDYFSDYPEMPENIYLFGFSLLNGTENQRVFDENIAKTICGILIEFFSNHENVIVFICDSTDKRERQRNITFNKWFHHFDTDSLFEKIDKVLEYDSLNRYYLSLIYRKDNPKRGLYLKAFQNMTSDLEK